MLNMQIKKIEREILMKKQEKREKKQIIIGKFRWKGNGRDCLLSRVSTKNRFG